MELTINVDSLDKTNSAVNSTSDRTAVDSLETLAVGNVEPFIVSFCDDNGAVPAFVTDAGTVVSIGLGIPTTTGSQSFATVNLTVSGSTRIGSLDMDSQTLRDAVALVGCVQYCGRNGRWLTLEIRRVTTVTGTITAAESIALLSVFVALPVLAYA